MGWGAHRAQLAHGLLQMIVARVGLGGEPNAKQQPERDDQPAAEQAAVKGFHQRFSFHGVTNRCVYSTEMYAVCPGLFAGGSAATLLISGNALCRPRCGDKYRVGCM
ncbi:hypothetical protein D3C79_779280 [compost metagenome]